ncbi:hypothetical protein [Paenibacillus sp. YYML68]|uniref:hypothetical protein n=1 Tax=Paenibacillus sp. YYML68 TaxID=2909250 RepID=UPI00248FA677|nr:hypothetical protein [Paenibacillus sp. YYML68]
MWRLACTGLISGQEFVRLAQAFAGASKPVLQLQIDLTIVGVINPDHEGSRSETLTDDRAAPLEQLEVCATRRPDYSYELREGDPSYNPAASGFREAVLK